MACKRRKSNSISNRLILGTAIDDKECADILAYEAQKNLSDNSSVDCTVCKRKFMLKIAKFGLSHLLTEKQRKCYVRKINGEKAVRIAKEMDMSLDSVYKHIRIAKAKLEKLNEIY